MTALLAPPCGAASDPWSFTDDRGSRETRCSPARSTREVAPTVAQTDKYIDYGTPWQEHTLTVGKALGREATPRQSPAPEEVPMLITLPRTPIVDDATRRQVLA